MERFDGELGFGCSKSTNIFKSDLFMVNIWTHQSGSKKTEITCSALPNDLRAINIKGEYRFDSDEKCIEQYSFQEISLMLKGQMNNGIQIGKNQKVAEIKKCFSIPEIWS